MTRVVALYRSRRYSPAQHGANDRAILDAVLERLAQRGWGIVTATEEEVEAGRIPRGEIYLNMCQGPVASERLAAGLPGQALVVNHPGSVLRCHRHRLVPAMARAELPFPRSVVVESLPLAVPGGNGTALSLGGDGALLWVKRGDVHAERVEDVVAVSADRVRATVAGFAERGIERVIVQEHVPGPIVKFYGVGEGEFFHWYSAGPDQEIAVAPDRLRALACRAAAALGLAVFGGDIALPAPDRPVLIDLNDWPSFAPVRQVAAEAIASYVERRAMDRKDR